MNRILDKMIEKPCKLAAWLLLLGMSTWIGIAPALAEWRSPAMSDYIKVPIFTSSGGTKPNIMIILDNSMSMNQRAYKDEDFNGIPYNDGTRSFTVALERDDMEENSTGAMRDGAGSGNDLDFGTDYVGIRFQNVNIPNKAVITSARIEFTSKGSWSSVATFLQIKGEASDDATFLDATASYNISSRPMTTAQALWIPGDWVADQRYSTPDLSAVVQEIVNRNGWAAGNAMLFRVVNPGFPGSLSGHREGKSREVGEADGPILHITYVDQSAGTRYYGYFNPDFFYNNKTGNTFDPAYKKLAYTKDGWRVEAISKDELTNSVSVLTDSKIASEGLWDGNWMNWLTMRRIDVMRKVVMGGLATSRTGGGNSQNKGESPPSTVFFAVQSKTFTSESGKAVSPHQGTFDYTLSGGSVAGIVKVDGVNYTLSIQKYINLEPGDFFEGNLAGVLQRIGETRARWGNMWFNHGRTDDAAEPTGTNGGTVSHTIENKFQSDFLTDLEGKACTTYTPLAETFYVAMQYFKQEAIDKTLTGYPNKPVPIAGSNHQGDPYWDWEAKNFVPCAKSFVLLLTDGASTYDAVIPDTLKDYDQDNKDNKNCKEGGSSSNCNYSIYGTDFLDDLALMARTNDLRDLEGDQNILLYTVFAFDNDENGRNLLKDAARNGGFEDLNGDGIPNGTYTDPADQRLEWDSNPSDGIPDTYFEAKDGYKLEEALMTAINDILKRASSGTAASVVSNSRSGEGAIYQSIFYPATTAGSNTVEWVGQVHSLLSDAHGNIREDTNNNHKLDLADDLFIVFGDETLQKYKDSNADGIFDDYDEGPLTIGGETEFRLNQINFLWSSNDWLNKLTDPVTQRTYESTNKQRYIFTFVDADGDMAASTGEVKGFTANTDPSWAETIDPANYYAYIHAFKPFTLPTQIDPANPTALPTVIEATHPDFKSMVSRRIRRVINFTRGQDQAYEKVGALELFPLRNRQIDYDGDTVVETWRMGDIVYSTPTVVGQPAEEFDLIYRDNGYSEFFRRYRNRRNVVYVGSNDGMVHAFNSGFFDKDDNAFVTQLLDDQNQVVTDGITYNGAPYPAFEIGAELWAYVPFNLLSHLQWLTEPEYQHIFYNDLQPRIFDARIYPSKGPNDPINPNGWATVMVTGMRFGGGKIAADIVKDGSAYDPLVDKTMSSAYAIFDITNPEEPPKLLGEINFPDLGFTTCHPGVIPMRNFDALHKEQTNQWYLIFGSGPASGDAGNIPGANITALLDGSSNQQAVMYAIDLVKLAEDHKVVTLTATGPKEYTAATAADPYFLVRFSEANSFVSKPIAVDWNLDFNTDAAYFGVTYGDHTNGWNSKMRRLVMDNGTNPTVPANWTLNSTLLDLTDGVSNNLANGQPIVASASAGTDKAGDRWLFFGTGRFYSQEDKPDIDQQSYYGVKEPYTVVDNTKKFNYNAVTFNNLMDVTNIKVYENGTTLLGYGGSFQQLADFIENQKEGWRLDLDYKPGARNLGEAVLAGDVLTFTSYVPSAEPCSIAGESQVYALYYRTGTAYTRSIIGLDPTDKLGNDSLVLKRSDLGIGLTITPNIHVGREAGSQAYIQTSTGSIKPLEEDNPGTVKSGRVPVKPGPQTCP